MKFKYLISFLFLFACSLGENASVTVKDEPLPTSSSTSTTTTLTTTTTTIPKQGFFTVENLSLTYSPVYFDITGKIGAVSVDTYIDGYSFKGKIDNEVVDIVFSKLDSSEYSFKGKIGSSKVDVTLVYCPDCLIKPLENFTGKIASGSENVRANTSLCFDCIVNPSGNWIEGNFGKKVDIRINDGNPFELQFSGRGNIASIIGIFAATLVFAGY